MHAVVSGRRWNRRGAIGPSDHDYAVRDETPHSPSTCAQLLSFVWVEYIAVEVAVTSNG